VAATLIGLPHELGYWLLVHKNSKICAMRLDVDVAEALELMAA
jgi:hypothetical protein